MNANNERFSIDRNQFPQFSNFLNESEIIKIEKRLNWLGANSRLIYVQRMHEFLNSCSDYGRDWKSVDSVKIYLDNIYTEGLFAPSTLWSVNSCISVLHVELLGKRPLSEDKSLQVMLKAWNKNWHTKKAKIHEL